MKRHIGGSIRWSIKRAGCIFSIRRIVHVKSVRRYVKRIIATQVGSVNIMILEWLKDINERHPDFDVSKWIPPSTRYKHLSLKALWKMELY
jgi:hypothetical protein